MPDNQRAAPTFRDKQGQGNRFTTAADRPPGSTSNRGRTETKPKSTNTSHVKAMRDKFSQMGAESPPKASSPTTGRLSPHRKEPWSKETQSTAQELTRSENRDTVAAMKPKDENLNQEDAHSQHEDTQDSTYMPPEARESREEIGSKNVAGSSPLRDQNSHKSTGVPSPRSSQEFEPTERPLDGTTKPQQPSPKQSNNPKITSRKVRKDTRLQSMIIRIALMRCAIIDRRLENMVREFPTKDCDTMCQLAEESLAIAQRIKSNGLQARCLYWMGIAHGRQRNWEKAEQAFEESLKLNPDTRENERTTGLLPSEKASVEALKNSVHGRGQRADLDRKQREHKNEDIRDKLFDLDKSAYEELFSEWDMTPMWRPAKESIIQQWMRATDREFDYPPQLGSDGFFKYTQDEEGSPVSKWLAEFGTDEEKHYVTHGNHRQGPHTRLRKDRKSPSGVPLSKEQLRHRPLPINTSRSRPVGLGITMSGTPDGENHDTDHSEVPLDDRTSSVGSPLNVGAPTTADYGSSSNTKEAPQP